jgi:hypothetical protein
MKIKKAIEIEETICDVCGIRDDQTFMSNCSICGKDICTEHTYLITSLGSSTSVGRLCPDCLTERFKPKDEDCPSEHWLFGGEE